MADLSHLFGAPQSARPRRDPFGMAAPKAQQYKRKIVMAEAMKQDLAPDDGEPFYKFVGRRLFEVGDIEGAMAVNNQYQQVLAGQAAAQQQGFENDLAASKYNLDVDKFEREAAEQPNRSEIMTGKDLGLSDPDLQNASIEVKRGANGQITDYQVLSKGGVSVTVDNREPTIGGTELSGKTLSDLQAQVMDSGEGIARLSSINDTYDERFLQLGTRLQEFGGRMKDFLGRATPQDQELITEFQDFKSTALDNLNLTLNQLSGAAVSPQEFKRISNALPNPGSGLFDGDSPTQFMSKMRRATRDLKLARARANYVLQGGGSLEDIQKGRLSLGGMKQIMQGKVDEWDKAGFSKEQIAVKLRETFGDF